MKFPQVNILQYSDDKTAIGLLNDFMTSPSVLGETMSKYNQYYRRGESEFTSEGEVMRLIPMKWLKTYWKI